MPKVEPNTVTVGGSEYLIKPINVVQTVRVTNMARSYIAKTSTVLEVFMRSKDEDTYRRASKALETLGQVLSDEELEQDIIKFVHLISDIPQDVLAEAPMEDLLDALPKILELSHVNSLLKKLNSLQSAVPKLTASLASVEQQATQITSDIDNKTAVA